MRAYMMIFLPTMLLATGAESYSQVRESIAIIGTGDMGDSLGPKLAELGYSVIYGSRDPGRDSVLELLARTGSDATATSQQEAVIDADIVILAVPWPPMEQVAQNLGSLAHKIVIDISLPITQGNDGYMESIVETSSAEMIQAWNPDARVVKTLLATSAVIDDPGMMGRQIATFIAADDRHAKETVAKIAHELGLMPIDAGPLRYAREIEGIARIWYAPVLQRRSVIWELAVQPTNFWACVWQDDWSDPVQDSDDLADIPESTSELPPCSSYSVEP